MPELPEVETVVRAVRPRIRGSMLQCVIVSDPKLKSRRLSQLRGRIAEVRRHGKYIIWDLESGESLVIHLRMTGNLIWIGRKKKDPVKLALGGAIINHSLTDGTVIRSRCEFACSNGRVLFADTRRFGTVKVVAAKQSLSLPGIDPFVGGFSETVFLNLLGSRNAGKRKSRRRGQPIKNWLLRQDKVAGVGNIYASEILFDARISPLRSVSELSLIEGKRLYRSITKILRRAIKHCGTTFSDFRGFDGESGSFQKFLKVYDRQDEPCRVCRAAITRIVQSGRSTYYCGRCQK